VLGGRVGGPVDNLKTSEIALRREGARNKGNVSFAGK